MVGILPTTLEADGVSYEINSDFRACLAVLAAFEDASLTNRDKLTVALTILYGEENLPRIVNYKEAYEKAMWFLNCGKAFAETEPDELAPPLMDWEQDEQLIFSGIAATIGRDVRAEGYCHYWAFISYFMGMGECTFTAVKAIRHKLGKHEKLEKWEQDFYRENRELVDLRREVDWKEELYKRVFGVV